MSNKSSNIVFKIIILIVLVVACVAMAIFYNRMQKMQSSNENLSTTIKFEKKRNKSLGDDNKNLQREIEKKEIDIEQLKVEILNKDEKIIFLQDDKSKLNQKISEQTKKLENLFEKLQEATSNKDLDSANQVKFLINQMKEERANLRKEKNDLEEMVSKLEKEKQTLLEEKSQIAKQKLDYKFSLDSLQTITNEQESIIENLGEVKTIVENLKIDLTEFSLTEEENSRGLRKLNRRNREKWQYSNFQFTLDFPNDSLLLNKKLAFQIVDLDTGYPLENKEKSPTRNYLIPFYYQKEPIQLSHFNYEKKVSDNYELQFVLIDDGEIHLLYHGKFSIVTNGKINN